MDSGAVDISPLRERKGGSSGREGSFEENEPMGGAEVWLPGPWFEMADNSPLSCEFSILTAAISRLIISTSVMTVWFCCWRYLMVSLCR